MAPRLLSVVLDTTDPRALAEFYRVLLAMDYREGDEVPPAGEPDPKGGDWLVLRGAGIDLAFQRTDDPAVSTWPEVGVPQQLHLDLTVGSRAELDAVHARALDLGARVLLDRTDDPDEPLWVYADLAGHPFCVFVAT